MKDGPYSWRTRVEQSVDVPDLGGQLTADATLQSKRHLTVKIGRLRLENVSAHSCSRAGVVEFGPKVVECGSRYAVAYFADSLRWADTGPLV